MPCNTFCGCGELRTTGTPTRQAVIEDGTGVIFVPLFDDDGTENQILRSDSLDQDFFQAKVNEPDPSKRWYPIGNFTNVTNERAESTFETFSDNSRARTLKGLRTFTGDLIGYAPNYASVIEAFRCYKMGVFTVDDCGKPIGKICLHATDPQLDAFKPALVSEKSIDSLVMFLSDAASEKVRLQFDYSQLVKDSQFSLLTNEEMGGANLLNLIKLQPTKTAISGQTATGFVATITLDYGQWTATAINGLLTSDFRLFNNTTQSEITITSATETGDGVYTFVIPSTTLTDSLTLTQASGTVKPFSVNKTFTLTV